MRKTLFILVLILSIMLNVAGVQAKNKVLLIPLDSRPPCKNFVIDIARIADIEIDTPPHELLDYYTLPGEVTKTRQWIIDNSSHYDDIIISIDQILSGGLIAAREDEIDNADIDSVINFLTELKQLNPNVSIYAFSILPRLQPQSTIENYNQRQALIEYSRLIGSAPTDYESLIELDSIILPENKKKYFQHFEENLQLSKRLIELLKSNTLTRLIIGCDDAEPFSIQNIEISQLENFIRLNDVNAVNITHGADEIAMTLLMDLIDYSPKICVRYNQPDTGYKILPFMSASIGTVVTEKIRMIHGTIVASPDDADFTLFVSVNDSDFNSRSNRDDDAKFINDLIINHERVAIVDLSSHFNKNETLLPVLINKNIPINSLIAYSGWNTASNSIGTTLTQATLFTSQINKADMINLYRNNLIFLNQRFIEDQFYLKDGIDAVNISLKKSGSYDTSYLNFNNEYPWATFVLNTVMDKKIDDYKRTSAFNAPIHVDINHDIEIKNLTVTMAFPWPRTFEIDLTCFIDIDVLSVGGDKFEHN